MQNVLTIARRELGAHFESPMAYIVTAAFLLINGIFFYMNVYYGQQATIRPVVQTVLTILLLLTPVLSMRLLAEEQRSGTLELLLTAPVRDSEVVIGKYLAGLGFLSVMIGLTLFYAVILLAFGSPDRGALFGGYLAMFLFGMAAMSIGLFASSLSQNQIVAAVIAFAILLILWVADGFSSIFGSPLQSIVSYIALYPHFDDMTKGVIDTKDIVYYLSLVVVPLFLTARSLEARRWRG